MAPPTSRYIDRLSDKRVLIIGGSSGIGYAVAEGALEHDAIVTIAGSNPSKLKRAMASLQTSYPTQTANNRLRSMCCNLSDTSMLDTNLVQLLKLAADDGKINHVVYTAAEMTQPPLLADLTAEVVQKFGMIRFVAPLILAKHLPVYMDRKKENSLTLTSGAHTHKPDPGWTVVTGYCGAVEAAMKGLAVDLKPLRVNVVSPGAVLTTVVRDILGDAFEEGIKAAAEKSTVGAVGNPEEVAQAYLYLMKDSYVSGTVLESNGGMMLM
ncbi:uncharacterized protein N7515_006724 [Penicillium bovifimosum]|uniref:Uncharacterized protein n=1 Tax=Penicillium bovifimosum TaxID=126998 RepID=A0A9W9L1E0_9EURO|nr:uncharacterized protein N7515_006724 [Penicillium bovifimosum]KAJ5130685.1 hypothetical protein N7515_006724 [Penicillium bovifimosum]